MHKREFEVVEIASPNMSQVQLEIYSSMRVDEVDDLQGGLRVHFLHSFLDVQGVYEVFFV